MKKNIKLLVLIIILIIIFFIGLLILNRIRNRESGPTVPGSITIDASKNLGEMPEVFGGGMELHYLNLMNSYLNDKLWRDMNKNIFRTVPNYPPLTFTESFDDFKKKLNSSDDVVLKYSKENGAKLIIQIDGMPKWLSSGCKKINGSYSCIGNGNQFTTYPPNNYTIWSDIVYEIVNHYNNELGLRDYLYYEIWNEPDLDFWNGTTADYLKVYNYSVLGALRADPNLKIGGPAASMWNKGKEDQENPVIYELIKYCSTNHVPLDFVTWHTYIGWNNFYGTKEEYKEMKDTIKGWLGTFGLNQNIPFIIDEWNYNAGHDNTYKLDSEFTASYAPFALFNMDGYINSATFFILKDANDAYPNEFPGSWNWGAITKNSVIKPVYNSFKALSILNGKPENQTPNRLEALLNENENLTVIASQTKDKSKTRVLLSNFIPEDNTNKNMLRKIWDRIFDNPKPRELNLKINNLPFTGKATLTTYTIDKDHANSCRYNYKTASDKSTACGINGTVDKGVAQAEKEAEEKAMIEATNYLKTRGYTDQQLSIIKSNLIEPCLGNENFGQCVSAKLQTFCSSFIQPAVYPSTCQILEQDLKKDAYKVYQESYEALFYYGAYTNQKGQKMTTSIWIDKINSLPEISLEGSKTTKQITITNGNYQETISLQPYSVVLVEIER